MERIEEQMTNFNHILKDKNSQEIDAVRALLDMDYVFVGLSAAKGFQKIDGDVYGSVAAYGSEEVSSYINIFTDVDAAAEWQKYYNRPVGILEKDKGFNGVYAVAAICGIRTLWINEGHENAAQLQTALAFREIKERGGKYLVLPDGWRMAPDGGMFIGMDAVKCPVVAFEAEED